jgi:hypothetical protein
LTLTIKGAADATTAWPLFAATLLGIPGKSQPKLQSKAMGAYEGWQEFVGMTCNQGLMFGCVRLLVVHLQLYVWIQALTKQALHYFTFIYIYICQILKDWFCSYFQHTAFADAFLSIQL